MKIVGMKMLVPNEAMARSHYTEDLAIRRGEHVREMMIGMITSGPIIAIALEGVEAVEVVRKLVGTTEPKAAAPGTIRGDFSHVSFKHADNAKIGIFNLIHASGSPEEVPAEIAVWFRPEELLEHHPSYTHITLKQ